MTNQRKENLIKSLIRKGKERKKDLFRSSDENPWSFNGSEGKKNRSIENETLIIETFAETVDDILLLFVVFLV